MGWQPDVFMSVLFYKVCLVDTLVLVKMMSVISMPRDRMTVVLL
jgi:hypothetical protein